MIYLGTINNAGSDVQNNKTTSTPFDIPVGTVGLRLQPSTATMLGVMKIGASVDPTFLPAASAMAQLGAANSFNDCPMRVSGGVVATVAVRKSDAGAGTCAVFAIGFGQAPLP